MGVMSNVDDIDPQTTNSNAYQHPWDIKDDIKEKFQVGYSQPILDSRGKGFSLVTV